MKLSLYTLLTYDISLAESVLLASKTGFDAVDIRMAADGTHFPLDITDEAAKHARVLADKASLEISGLTTYYSLGLADDKNWQGTREAFKRACHICHLLGARFLRCSGPHWEFEAGYEKVRTAFRTHAQDIATLAEREKITVTIEQHSGLLFASAGQILDMMRGIESPYLGIVYDPGNCISEGYERPSVQIDMLKKMIRAVHMKNYRNLSVNGPSENECLPMEPRRLDQGVLDWAKIILLLKDIGYNDYITLEDFYEFPSLEEKFAWDVHYLRSLI